MREQINHPDLWLADFPFATAAMHKYSRGCAMVFGGRLSGAGCLSARAAQRAGAGIVHVIAPADLLLLYASTLLSCVVRSAPLDVALADERVNAYLIGPGADVGAETQERVIALLATQRPLLLDAGALSSFADQPHELLSKLHSKVVLTPHSGELARLMVGHETPEAVADRTGATFVLKGSETRILSGSQPSIINKNAPADLASAGTGDVLAGLITGLLAQGMSPFLAAAAGVWLQTIAALQVGTGLIAEDMEGQIPSILASLKKNAA